MMRKILSFCNESVAVTLKDLAPGLSTVIPAHI